MKPCEVARVDQIRAGIQAAIGKTCDCGRCPPQDQLRALLLLDDVDLLRIAGKHY